MIGISNKTITYLRTYVPTYLILLISIIFIVLEIPIDNNEWTKIIIIMLLRHLASFWYSTYACY